MTTTTPPLSKAEQADKRLKDKVSNVANRSKKTSWNRKMDRMIKLLAELKPIEDQLLDFHTEKNKIFDLIQQLRADMVIECVHPSDQLVILDDKAVLCKFCNKKMVLNDKA